MILAIDTCVSRWAELELWRAGFQVPVRAGSAEPDESWLDRAIQLGCKLVVTSDRGASQAAAWRGMDAALLASLPGDRTVATLDAVAAWVDGNYRAVNVRFSLVRRVPDEARARATQQGRLTHRPKIGVHHR